MKSLHSRLTLYFLGIASGIILIATVILIAETRYHFAMIHTELPELDIHFELALEQAIIWTCAGAVLLAAGVSFYVAKRITKPLLDMRHVAEQMAEGHLAARAAVRGEDELAGLGQSLNELAQQLQTQEELRKNMTADIAHELRTPLSTLKSHIEAFQDGIWEPTPPRIHACYEEIERLIHLVRDLEELTRMEAPDFQLERRREELTAVVRQGVEAVEAAFLQKGVRVELGTLPDVWVDVDRQRMMQVIVNLMTNALKFTPEGGQVRVAVTVAGDVAVVRVRDTGIGIAAEELPYVFERFYRVDKSRNRNSGGGGGIGLTIVKRLVEAHGGTIEMRSEPGVGTTVDVMLPVVS